jgi:hypothetical protein
MGASVILHPKRSERRPTVRSTHTTTASVSRMLTVDTLKLARVAERFIHDGSVIA